MFRRLLASVALLLGLAPVSALALNCSGNPFTLTNGTTADATQVMANFNNLLTCSNNNLAHNGANSDITSLSALTSVSSSPTFGGTVTVTGVATLTSGAVLGGAENWTSATLASAGTVNIGAAAANYIFISGNANITAFDTVQSGTFRMLEFQGALTLTNGAALILPGGANITTAAGDLAGCFSEGAGNLRCSYTRAAGTPPRMATVTNSLSGDVALNNVANYFDGPSVAQGTAGTWCAFGTVTVVDSAQGSVFDAELWDGTTVIASGNVNEAAGSAQVMSISLSGCLAAPAGNLRISVKDTSATSGLIKFNVSGLSKDSTITAIRIQ